MVEIIPDVLGIPFDLLNAMFVLSFLSDDPVSSCFTEFVNACAVEIMVDQPGRSNF